MCGDVDHVLPQWWPRCFAAVAALRTKTPSDWRIWSKKQAGPTKTCGGPERSNGQKQTPCPQPPAATEEQLQRKTFRESRTGQEQELFDVTGTLCTSQPDVPSPLLLFHLRAETGSCLLLNDPLTQATSLNTTTKTLHATSALHMVIYSIRIIYSSSFPGLEQSFTMLDEVIFRVTLQLESFLK